MGNISCKPNIYFENHRTALFPSLSVTPAIYLSFYLSLIHLQPLFFCENFQVRPKYAKAVQRQIYQPQRNDEKKVNEQIGFERKFCNVK